MANAKLRKRPRSEDGTSASKRTRANDAGAGEELHEAVDNTSGEWCICQQNTSKCRTRWLKALREEDVDDPRIGFYSIPKIKPGASNEEREKILVKREVLLEFLGSTEDDIADIEKPSVCGVHFIKDAFKTSSKKKGFKLRKRVFEKAEIQKYDALAQAAAQADSVDQQEEAAKSKDESLSTVKSNSEDRKKEAKTPRKAMLDRMAAELQARASANKDSTPPLGTTEAKAVELGNETETDHEHDTVKEADAKKLNSEKSRDESPQETMRLLQEKYRRLEAKEKEQAKRVEVMKKKRAMELEKEMERVEALQKTVEVDLTVDNEEAQESICQNERADNNSSQGSKEVTRKLSPQDKVALAETLQKEAELAAALNVEFEERKRAKQPQPAPSEREAVVNQEKLIRSLSANEMLMERERPYQEKVRRSLSANQVVVEEETHLPFVREKRVVPPPVRARNHSAQVPRQPASRNIQRNMTQQPALQFRNAAQQRANNLAQRDRVNRQTALRLREARETEELRLLNAERDQLTANQQRLLSRAHETHAQQVDDAEWRAMQAERAVKARRECMQFQTAAAKKKWAHQKAQQRQQLRSQEKIPRNPKGGTAIFCEDKLLTFDFHTNNPHFCKEMFGFDKFAELVAFIELMFVKHSDHRVVTVSDPKITRAVYMSVMLTLFQMRQGWAFDVTANSWGMPVEMCMRTLKAWIPRLGAVGKWLIGLSSPTPLSVKKRMPSELQDDSLGDVYAIGGFIDLEVEHDPMKDEASGYRGAAFATPNHHVFLVTTLAPTTTPKAAIIQRSQEEFAKLPRHWRIQSDSIGLRLQRFLPNQNRVVSEREFVSGRGELSPVAQRRSMMRRTMLLQMKCRLKEWKMIKDITPRHLVPTLPYLWHWAHGFPNTKLLFEMYRRHREMDRQPEVTRSMEL